jgi:hypothetical protein
MNTNDQLIRAHDHSVCNKAEVLESQLCGCFYCLRTFHPNEIVSWWGDANDTAVCPYCGIDAAIGDRSKLPVTREFLKQMRQYWFTEAE